MSIAKNGESVQVPTITSSYLFLKLSSIYNIHLNEIVDLLRKLTRISIVLWIFVNWFYRIFGYFLCEFLYSEYIDILEARALSFLSLLSLLLASGLTIWQSN